MEKLFNWTIGSFFRTIGRLIAYFAIGAFIAYILSNSNIKLPRITNLFLEKVNAAETVINVTPYPAELYVNGNGSSGFGTTADYNTFTKTIYNSSDQIHDYIAFQSGGFDTTRFDYIEFDFSISQPLTTTSTSSEEGRRCIKWRCSSTEENVGPTWKYCTQWTCDQTGTWTQGTETTVYENVLDGINFSFTINLANGWVNTCSLNNGKILCPTYKTQITQLNIYTHFDTATNTNFDMFISRRVGIYNIQDIQGAIDHQSQQQQQQHNETMTIVTDTNTTQEQNETTSFFENFTFSSDNSGLVGVITAPLRVINSIVDGQFSDLCFTLKSKNVCFPNGNMIWQKSNRDSTWFGSGSISSGIQAFVSLFNLVAGGYILYKMGVSIKRLTEDLINPTNTRIEVMKL